MADPILLVALACLSGFFIAAGYWDLRRERKIPIPLVLLGVAGLASFLLVAPQAVIQVAIAFLFCTLMVRVKSKGKPLIGGGDAAALTFLAVMPGVLLPIGMLAAGLTGLAHYRRTKGTLEAEGYPIVTYIAVGFFICLAVVAFTALM